MAAAALRLTSAAGRGGGGGGAVKFSMDTFSIMLRAHGGKGVCWTDIRHNSI